MSNLPPQNLLRLAEVQCNRVRGMSLVFKNLVNGLMDTLENDRQPEEEQYYAVLEGWEALQPLIFDMIEFLDQRIAEMSIGDVCTLELQDQFVAPGVFEAMQTITRTLKDSGFKKVLISYEGRDSFRITPFKEKVKNVK